MALTEQLQQNPVSERNKHFHRIQATKGLRGLRLGELWAYRELLWYWTMRDIKGRYRQMALGPLWIVLQPIVNTIVFSIIFGNLAGLDTDGLPPPLFVFSGLLLWNFFTSSASSAVGSLAGNMGLISKVYFPRLLTPLKGIAGAFVDLLISCMILAIFMLIYQYGPSWQIIFLPLYIVLAAASGLAIGLWSAAITVRFRDFRNVISYGLRLGLYTTPVVYSLSEIPEQWVWLYKLNPLYWVIDGARWSILNEGLGPEPYMLISIAVVLVLVISGAFVFRSAERTVVDWL